MKRSLKELAEFVQARVVGDGGVEVTGISSIQSASHGDLVFVEDEKNLRAALESPASAVIVGSFATGKTNSKPLLVSAQPRLAFARAAQLLCPREEQQPGIHPSAVVYSAARLGKGVTVRERAVIGEGAEIGSKTRIGAGSVIGAGVSVGRDCDLYPNVTIYPGTRLGDRVIVHAGAVLGSDGFG